MMHASATNLFSRGEVPRLRLRLERLVLVLLLFLGSGHSWLRGQNYATPYNITTLAGSAGSSGSIDGTGSGARFYTPFGVAVDGSGNVYVADSYNDIIRKITPDGAVTTLAGAANQIGSADGTGSTARFSAPIGIAVDGRGVIYVGDTYNDTIRKITPAGVVTTLAGSAGNPGSTNGTGATALFHSPAGVAVDGSGNVYVADASNSIIRKITSVGVVSTLAGSAGHTGNGDGTGSVARFYVPKGVAVDGSGNVYIADTGNNTIRQITPAGTVTTLAGSGSFDYFDGASSAAGFSGPSGVAVDGSGNVYVVDSGDNAIRKISLVAGGVVTTLAGFVDHPGSSDGTGRTAQFDYPYGIAADIHGTIYVADMDNNTVRKGVLAADVFGGKVTGVNMNYSRWFGYYTTAFYPLVYEYNLGYEYVFPTSGGVYLYDYTCGHFWYTQASYFPFVYDFTLNAYLWYYAGNGSPRYFYDYGTDTVISE